MLLEDKEIRHRCSSTVWKEYGPMLEPFSEAVSGNGIISFGLTSAGYDLRLDSEVLLFVNHSGEIVDPKRFKDPEYSKKMFFTLQIQEDGSVIIPPKDYVLGQSLEYIRMPKKLKGRCVGKSTLARCGIFINTTPLEPEWEGHLTIEISNLNNSPGKIFPGQGIAQLEFEMLYGTPEMTYAGKSGQYQKQMKVTPPMVK